MSVSKICCIGAGYVGAPTMAVIALKCPHLNITVVDNNKKKIQQWNGPIDNLPVYEPGLSEIIQEVRNKNLFFSTEIQESINDADMIFIAVNTPTKVKGKGAGMAADLKYVESSAKTIAKFSKTNKIIVEKSTLPVRTAEKIKEILNKNNRKVKFEVLSNPEFLAEGTAIQDLFKSDRVLIGGDSTKSGQKAVKSLVNIYKNWIPSNKILTVNVWSAELSKLASNAMLAQRISSINSLSALCEKTEADIEEVSTAIGMDKRIGNEFLKVSPGFGGSCFKKDILNLVYLCQFYGLNEVAEYWNGVIKINDFQRSRIFTVVDSYIKKVKIKKEISILGWAFKKNTNDTRESSSIYIASQFLKNDYKINIYDPKVKDYQIKNDLNILGHSSDELEIKAKYFNSLDKLINQESPILIMTEWDEFKNINNKKSSVFDFRNILDKSKVTYRF